MSISNITDIDLRNNLSRILDECEEGATFIITKNDNPVAVLSSGFNLEEDISKEIANYLIKKYG